MRKNNRSKNKLTREKLKAYAKRQSRPLSIGFLFAIVRTGMEIIGPIIIGYILNNHIKLGMEGWHYVAIIKLLALYLLVSLLAALFSNLAIVSFEEAANQIAFNVQKDVYRHVMDFPVSYFDNLPAGNIVSRITNDTNRLKMMFKLILADISTSSIIVVAIYIMIAITNPLVALLLLVLAPIVYLIFKDLRYKTGKYTSLNRRYVGDINSSINENIQNMEIIQAFNKEDHIKGEFDAINQEIFRTNLEVTKVRSYGGYRAIDALSYVATLLVLLYFGFGKITASYPVTIGSMYIVIDYVSKIFTNMNIVVTRFGEMEQSYASAKYIFDLLELETREDLPERIENVQGEVRFEDVYFAYKEEDVLRGISFQAKSGQSIAIVGSTGSGKSTIINLILKFYSPRLGNIYVDGRNIENINRASLRKHMAVVLQSPFIFETSIKDNIKLDNEEFTDEDVERALVEVGGQSIVKRGIDQEIHEKGSNFSQGEKQLISFARAYIRNPKILILDEATSNIDTETEKLIQKGIEKLKENRTTFIIAHRLSTIKDVDKIIVLNKGRIIERGNHDSLMELNGFYKNMYDEQIRNQ